MSKEVFEMLCAMDRRRVELQIVLQCAPTLAGLKTSNLLILPRDMEDKARYALKNAGLLGYRLVYDRNRVIFLVFNRKMLHDYLMRDEVKSFLLGYGYHSDNFGASLRFFQKRYDSFITNRIDFPHEMGVFLGYPLCDVKGFINNQGDGFEAAGYWKVYGDTCKTLQLFSLFDDVKDDMVCKISRGYTLKEILKEASRSKLAG